MYTFRQSLLSIGAEDPKLEIRKNVMMPVPLQNIS